MPEESLYYFSVFGLKVYYYGLCAALGALLALLTLCLSGKKRGLKCDAVLLFGVLALPLGLISSRVLFCLLDANFAMIASVPAALRIWDGGLSMMGALLGACAAGLISARITKTSVGAFLDALAPALLVFVACARVGERFISDEYFMNLLGRSRPLAIKWLDGTFLVTSDGYGVSYLNTYIFEAVCACVLAVVAFIALYREKKPGDAFLVAMLLFGCTQVLWESLRFDFHMRLSFVSLQQVLAAVMFAVPLLVFAARLSKKAVIWAVVIIAVAVGAAVGIELMIDRRDVNNLLLYGLYVLFLSAPIVFGLIWKNEAARA